MNQHFPRVLVLKDKHATSYYLITDEAALFRAALQILQLRFEQQYIGDPGSIVEQFDELSQEAAEALPEPYRKDALQRRRTNARLRKAHAEAVKQYQDAKKALAEGDGRLAYAIIDARRDHEYEDFELERITVP